MLITKMYTLIDDKGNIFQIFIKHFELCPASFSKLKLFQMFDLNLTPPQICSQHFQDHLEIMK